VVPVSSFIRALTLTFESASATSHATITVIKKGYAPPYKVDPQRIFDPVTVSPQAEVQRR
jgi:hypothetical protein